MTQLHIENIDDLIEQINERFTDEEKDSILDLVKDLHCADLAYILDHSQTKLQKHIINIAHDLITPDTLLRMCDGAKQVFLEIAGYKKVAELVEELDLEDSIEVLDGYNEEIKNALINHLSEQKKIQVTEGFNYPEDCVGRIMEKDFLIFEENWSVEQAIDYIKNHKHHREYHAAIMVDKKYRPIGILSLSRLFQHPHNTPLKKILNPELKKAYVNDKINNLVYFFKQYTLAIIPVIGRSGKLVGSISIDNMLYIIEESTESDIMNLTGVGEQDTFDGVLDTAKHRFLWLFMNLLIAFMTALVINEFSQTIIKVIALASLMPIVASMCGNASTQVMTVTVRALSKKDINRSNIFRVILKEIAVCQLNAFLLSCIGSLLIGLIYNNLDLSIVFSVAVMINFFLAGLFGALIPITLDKFDIDPATASGVFLNALTDGLGAFIFLGLSYLILN